jgi:hypothetical protein
MKLSITVGDKVFSVELSEQFLAEAESFYQKMDHDMDRGWQMGREFIEQPDRTQRCQIAANRLMTSMSTGNTTMVELMAGYILSRLPGVSGVDVDTSGEMGDTEFAVAAPSAATAGAAQAAPSTHAAPLNRLEALTQAGKDISKVYASGRGYRYAVLNRATGQWVESALADTEKEAEERRLLAVKHRYQELIGEPVT